LRNGELTRRTFNDFTFPLSQDILSQSTVALHIEVRPRYLVPDTNCFVDDLKSIKAIASAHPLYQLMIPITGKENVVDGLSPGSTLLLQSPAS